MPEARIGEGLLDDLGFTTEPGAVPPVEEQPAAFQPVQQEPVKPVPLRTLPPTRPAGRAADAQRGGGRQLRAPAPTVLREGSPHKARTKANDKGRRGPAGRVRAVQGRRDGGGLHPRPDGSPGTRSNSATASRSSGSRALQEHLFAVKSAEVRILPVIPASRRSGWRSRNLDQGDRQPRRHAPLRRRHRRPSPDGGGLGKDVEGKDGPGQPGEDAARPRGRCYWVRQGAGVGHADPDASRLDHHGRNPGGR